MTGVSSLIQLIVYLILGAVVIYIVYLIVGMLGLPAQLQKLIFILIAVVVLIWLLITFHIIPGV